MKNNITGIYPLSKNQEGLLIHNIMNEGTAYQEVFSCNFKGEFDPERFSNSMQSVLDLYPQLRTAFIWKNREFPVQAVINKAQIPYTFMNWENIDKDQRDKDLNILIRREENNNFDLTKAPSMRTFIIKNSENDYSFVWSFPHILLDGWSLPLLLKDVLNHYRDGKIDNIQRKKVSYFDFIAWQKSQDWSKSINYWKKYLGNNLSFSNIEQIGLKSPKVPCESVFFELSALETKHFHQFAKSIGVTENILLQLLWSVVINKVTEESEILIGETNAGRPMHLDGIDEVVGLFINTLPVKICLDSEISLIELIKDHNNNQLVRRNHDLLPAVTLQQHFGQGKSFFDTLLVYENYPINSSIKGDGLFSIKDVKILEATHYPLTIIVSKEEKLLGRFIFDDKKFSGDFAKQLCNYFSELISTIEIISHLSLKDINWGTTNRKKKLLETSGSKNELYPKEICVGKRFSDIAEICPDKIALKWDSRCLSYRDLDTLSNNIALHFISLGLKIEDLVAFKVNPGFNNIALILGIVKAGGTFVPLNGEIPEERIFKIFSQGEIKYFIHEEGEQLTETDLKTDLISITELISSSKEYNGLYPDINIIKQNRLYIMFTSGSTGIPKGVEIVHENVLRLVDDNSFIDFTGEEIWLQLATQDFDASTLEIWGSLLNGGTLVIPRSRHIQLENLEYDIKNEKVTHLWLTAGLFHLIAQEKAHILNPLKVLLAGGDILQSKMIKLIQEMNPSLKVINGYGPTENTTFSTTYNIDQIEPFQDTPIGKPIDYSQSYVVSGNCKLLPPYIPGELWVGGSGLARGYWNDPVLTATKFVASPFKWGERLYRTGDKVYWDGLGNLHFIGRLDYQVKLRGYRIELGEIESVLLELSEITDAVVVVKEINNEKYLIAYIKGIIEIEAVKSQISKKLPDYMIPSSIIKVNEFQYTRSHKIDRKALPEPDFGITDSKTVDPDSAEELKLWKIWSEILGITNFGVTDNFFRIGGHSLLATQIVSRIKKDLDKDLKLSDFFENNTIREQLKILSKGNNYIPIIKHKEYKDRIPLSFSQERLWFLDQYDHNSSYNIPRAIKLTGRLSINLLLKTFDEIVRRHEVLRTNFESVDGIPSQVINDFKECNVLVEDHSYLSENEAEQNILELIKIESKKIFDLRNDSLIRFKIYRISDDKHVIFLNIHHIISDGWSFSILFNEISTIYEELSENKTLSLPELGIQYADYSIWQREYLSNEQLGKQLEYWKNNLSDTLLLELPTDYLRPAEQTFNGSKYTFKINSTKTKQLNDLSNNHDVTLFMTLLSALNILLQKYSGQNDICIGTPIANRTRSEVEPLIGFFVNTLALRSDLSEDLSFIELLKQVKKTTLSAYENQDVPFEKVVDMVVTERELSYSPLFQVMMVLQNNPEGDLFFGDLKLDPVDITTNVSKFDLTLNFTEVTTGIDCEIVYNTDLFEKKTIEDMVNHFYVLLDLILIDSKVKISEIDILTSVEKERLLIDFNDTKKEYPIEKCIHKLFEEQVEQTPDNVAVVFDNNEVTYRELNKRANQLANYLHKMGVQPEDMVGIYQNRSLEMIICILGVLKAGGAYLPIDPSYPDDRIEYMISDSECKIILSKEYDRIDFLKNRCEIVINNQWVQMTHEYSKNLDYTVNSNNLAYVIYTSGSTGKPKGVMIQHNNLVDYISWAKCQYIGDEKLNFPLFTSLSFDLTITSIFTPLLSGNSIIIYKENDINSLLPKILSDKRLGIIKLTPAHLEMVKFEKFIDSIKYLILGGDNLTVKLASHIVENNPNITIFNEYGPTEATVGCMIHKFNPVTDVRKSVPIGIPSANTSLYIVDNNNNLTVPGVPGELCIAGDCLARGYKNREELTSQRFIINPFSKDNRSRLYRTGDLVKFLPDGKIEFLGRIDHQVKIKGFRIELGEIETTLTRLEAIKEAVVVTNEDINNNKRLIAYYISTHELNIDNIRSALAKSLPDYMIPSFLIRIDEIPITSNGKINKKALPSPEVQMHSNNDYVPPTNEVEYNIATIWQEVLGLEHIGINDNFFKIGGDSILTLQIVSRLSKIGYNISVKDLFENPDIKKLSLVVNQKETHNRIPIKLQLLSGKHNLSSAQLRLYMASKISGESNELNIPEFFIIDDLDLAKLKSSFYTLVERHPSLRTRFLEIEGIPKQEIVNLEEVDLDIDVDDLQFSSIDMEKVNDWIKKVTNKVIKIDEAPLFRITIGKTIDNKYLFSFIIHHIITDGWSNMIILKELVALYHGNQNLPSINHSYIDYIYWEKEIERVEDYSRNRDYWQDKLLTIIDRPQILPSMTIPSQVEDDVVIFNLSSNVNQVIGKLKEKGFSELAIFTATFRILLYGYTGLKNSVIGTPTAGRTLSELESIVGFFINILPLVNTIDTDKSFLKLLQDENETILEALDNQLFPYDQMIGLQNSTSNSNLGIFDYMVQYLPNDFRGEDDTSKWKARSLELSQNKAKYDMVWNFSKASYGYNCFVEYKCNLYNKKNILKIVERYNKLMEYWLYNPEEILSTFSFQEKVELPKMKRRSRSTV